MLMKYDIYTTEKACQDDLADEWTEMLKEYRRRGATVIGREVIGKNALTGEDDPSRGRTVRFAEPRQRRDGKWVKPAVENASVGNTAAVQQATTRKEKSENYDKTWFDAVQAQVRKG